MKTIKVLAKYAIKQGKIEEFKKLFAQMVAHTVKEPGNLIYRSYSDVTNENNFFIYEEYADLEALEYHKNSPHFKEIVINGILPLLETREVFQIEENQF